MTFDRIAVLTVGCLITGPSAALAQNADEVRTARALLADRIAAQQAESRAPAFVTEWAGGTLGSLAGLGLGLLIAQPSRCGGDDIECVFDTLGTVWLTSSLGSGAGVQIGGRLGDTNPSLTGALIGGVVGAVAGALVLTLMEEAVRTDGTLAVATFSLTQGLVSALGSRVGRALKRGGG